MARFCSENVQSRNGIKITDEASCGTDLYSYLAHGRAILNGMEASNFQNHLKDNNEHHTVVVYIEWRVLKRRDIINICRMFANTVTGLPFIASSMEENEAIDTIRNISTFHGLSCDRKLNDGFLILTDEKSVMLKNVMSSQEAL